MPAATKADVDKVQDRLLAIGDQIGDLKALYDGLRSGAGLTPVSNTTQSAAPPPKTNWTPIILLAGAGLVLFLLIKKGG